MQNGLAEADGPLVVAVTTEMVCGRIWPEGFGLAKPVEKMVVRAMTKETVSSHFGILVA